ncbi:MAG: hypothetical protein HY741_21530 [Chloroflexi bacterium]|nr:hypothetical protein [Chloroflexota bacterium]
MFKRILLLMVLVLLPVLLYPPNVQAQDPNPADLVFANLVGAGFDVVQVGYARDAQGNTLTDTVFVEMETITSDFNDRYIVGQVVGGVQALAKYFPHALNLLVVLKYDRWLFYFGTTAQDWDDVVARRTSGKDWWQKVLGGVRFYDTVQQKYITAKDFTSQNQTTKNQTNKDFSGQGDSPLPPVNTNPDAQAENILLEPSTTYLPADGTSQGYLLATLTDREFAGLPGRGVNFTYEVRGQDEKNLGVAQTNKFGTASSKITSSRALDLVLLRASTASLNASTQIVVGPAPGADPKAQAKAVIEGLASQGYRNADAVYEEYTGPTGATLRIGVAGVSVTSTSFDRQVYSQLSRLLGTLRTVMPKATLLNPILFYAASDGHDYRLFFLLRADIWDAYVRGDISENQLWANLSYNGAEDENGVFSNGKNFLKKNFTGAKQTRYSSAQRQVASTLTTEEWGEQLTVGSFLVPVGGFADTFSIGELSGSATGFTIYETPDYKTVVFAFNSGDEAALKNLRLDAGQYIVVVQGAGAPAKVNLQYVEHLGR